MKQAQLVLEIIDMTTDIHIHCDGNWSKPEVQISGCAQAMVEFAEQLNKITTEQLFSNPVTENEFYPVGLKFLNIVPIKEGNDKLTITVEKSMFSIEGTTVALNLLADSLINFFDDETQINDHFHLDYYDRSDVLNETNCSLIFICDH